MKAFIALALPILIASGCGGGSESSVVIGSAAGSGSSTLSNQSRQLADVVASDIVTFAGNLSSHTVTRNAGNATVTNSAGNVAPIAANVKRLVFDDQIVALDIDAIPGQMYRLYQAAFNRQPDPAGLGFQIAARERFEDTFQQVSQNFINSPEFSSTFGQLNDQQFIAQLYANVLHRAPDSAGAAFHLDALNKGLSRAQLLINFSESPENQNQVAPAIQNGVAFIPNAQADRCLASTTDPTTGRTVLSNACNFIVEVNYCNTLPEANGSTAFQCVAQPAGFSPTGFVFGRDTITIAPGAAQATRGSAVSPNALLASTCISRQASQAYGATPFIRAVNLQAGTVEGACLR